MSWEANVRIVTPYTAGEQPKDPNIIKLNTNECPYPPTPKVKEALKELESTTDRLRLYPDMNAARITRALSDYYQVDPDQVYVGVGSDDVLSMSFLTFFTSGKRVLFPDITYSFYDVWADLYRIPYTAVPLRDDFTIDPENYIPGSDRFAAEGETLGGIIFPNPNAPTGVELPLSLVEKILAANPDIPVIVDEAYVDFGAESALSLLPKYENLLIVQTFSKSRAMAGLPHRLCDREQKDDPVSDRCQVFVQQLHDEPAFDRDGRGSGKRCGVLPQPDGPHHQNERAVQEGPHCPRLCLSGLEDELRLCTAPEGPCGRALQRSAGTGDCRAIL